MVRSQPWIYSPFVDGLFILGVPFLVVAAVFAFPATFTLPDSMTVVSWAILVMGVDVSHVYSTLYRTYFDTETRQQHAALLYAINVMSHGIPYMALVWIWGRKAHAGSESLAHQVFRPRYVALYIGFLLLLGYMEEGFWNIWVWHEPEHERLFPLFHENIGSLEPGSAWLGLVVPLLSVPQVTHYIIDGFIWKIRDDRYNWRKVVLD